MATEPGDASLKQDSAQNANLENPPWAWYKKKVALDVSTIKETTELKKKWTPCKNG